MAGINKNFVVKNGLEVNSNLIYADADNNRVGINTNDVRYALHVNGGIGATSIYSSGISTFGNIHLSGDVIAGNAGVGSTGQYLVRTGTGVTWQNLPTARTSETVTATVGQTVFLFSYTIGLLDVFINGVKLSTSEYTANDGASIILNNACFGSETVEFISYNSVNPGYAFTGIYGISLFEEGSPVGTTGQVVTLDFVGAAVTATATGTGATVYINGSVNPNYWEQTSVGINTLSNVGLGTTNPRFALEVGAVGASGTSLWVNGNARVTGILTVGSSSIVLDGSTNTINVGSGITINGNTGIISASNFYASGIEVGVITATTIVYQNGTTLTQDWTRTASGIHTLASVGIGTTNPTSALTVQGDVLVSGVSTFGNPSIATDNLKISNVGDVTLQPGRLIYLSGNTNVGIRWTSALGMEIYNANNLGGDDRKITIQSSNDGDIVLKGQYDNRAVFTNNGATITGITSTTNLNVSGVSTFSGDIKTNGSNVVLGLSGGATDDRITWNTDSAEVYADTSRLYLKSQLANGINIFGTGTIALANYNGTKTYLLATEDGSVDLYHNNSKKFETLGAGVTVTGTTFTNQLSVSGVTTFGPGLSGNDGDIDLQHNGATRAYWDGSAGTLNFKDGNSVTFGDTDDVSMYWDGTDFYLTKNTVAGSIKFVKSTGSENIAVFSNDGPVELYYDNSKKFETTSSGVNIVGTTTTGQLSVTGIATIQGLTIKGNSTSYDDNVVITQHPASTFAGNRNVAIGDYSFTTPGAAGENVAIGYYALNIVGNNDTLNTWNGNTAVGAFAGQSATTTLYNTFIGHGAGRYVTTGDYNVVLGSFTGNQNDLDIRTSSNNVVLSDGAGNIRLIANAAGNVGLGTTNPTSALTVGGDASITGVTTSVGGFTSGIGVTDPVQITVSGNVLTFTVVGVGSTSLTLY